MQLLITHGRMARTHVLQVNRWQLMLAALLLAALLLLLAGAAHHFVFQKSEQDQLAERERFMRDNLDAIAHKVGEMQAKLLRVEAMGERLQGLAGVKLDELRSPAAMAPAAAAEASAPAAAASAAAAALSALSTDDGRGGPYLPLAQPSLEQLQVLVGGLDELTEFHADYLTLVESRLLESRLKALMIPSAAPVSGPISSGFGFRADPFNGRSALHTGLDFPAPTGTPVQAAAGGVVVLTDLHPEYGQMLEIDHGNGLATRYAHLSTFEVGLGALVKRGQLVARVGNTGRSTGAHLHFEVLVDGVPQNPARFLAGGAARPAVAGARPPPLR